MQSNGEGIEAFCLSDDIPADTAFTAPHNSSGNFQCKELLRDDGIELLEDAVRPAREFGYLT